MGNDNNIVALQFHPEVHHTQHGNELLRNFVIDMCGCCRDWTPDSILTNSVTKIRNQVGDGRVICGLSGGVDSSVTAALIERAIGEQLTAVLIDTGLLRLNEIDEIQTAFRSGFDMQLITVDASREFIDALWAGGRIGIRRVGVGGFVLEGKAAGGGVGVPVFAELPFSHDPGVVTGFL